MVKTVPAPRESPPGEKAGQYAIFDIEGMHCAGCAARVEELLSGVAGVVRARVNLVTHQASVEFDSEKTTAAALVHAVAAGGYSARPIPQAEDIGQRLGDREAREAAGWRRRLAVAAVLLAPLVWIAHFSRLSGMALLGWQFVLSTPIQFYVGWPYFAGALKRLRHFSANMDTLVALGTGTAYAAGLAALVRGLWVGIGRPAGVAAGAYISPPVSPGGHAGIAAMYFTDAAMILTFITLGKYLESKARGRASRAIRRLLDLSPPEANVLRGPRIERLPVRAVLPGETLVVRPGEKVPLDARVVSGASSVDQSWLTGESIPVQKQPGDEILAGTLNGQGSLTAEVLRAAGQTALDQVIELVRRAQESKTDLGRMADRVVAWFVPAVLAIAAASLLVWGLVAGNWSMAVEAAVAVLVVACPCAVGLATPAAVLVGSGRGAEQGILIKEARALETAGRLTTVVLDKTGTVTQGRPKVTAVDPAAGVAAEELLAVAAAAERLSQHPLAAAVVAEAEARRIPVPQADDLEVIAGQGIRARLGQRRIFVGTGQLLASQGIKLDEITRSDTSPVSARDGASPVSPGGHAGSPGIQRDGLPQDPLTPTLSQMERGPEDQAARIGSEGQTLLWVAAEHRLLGRLCLADPVSPESREAVQQLKAMGLAVQLLSGDQQSAAEAVARQIGIETVVAEVRPDEKQQVVRRLQQAGQVVAMVGDGINDAPALAAADLGIAIGRGSDVAIEAADVVLVGADLCGVARAIALSRATLRTIRQNLAWAFGYNLLLIPLAAGVLVPIGIHLPPAAAAAAMAASSVCVVSNSLLLRRRQLG